MQSLEPPAESSISSLSSPERSGLALSDIGLYASFVNIFRRNINNHTIKSRYLSTKSKTENWSSSLKLQKESSTLIVRESTRFLIIKISVLFIEPYQLLFIEWIIKPTTIHMEQPETDSNKHKASIITEKSRR